MNIKPIQIIPPGYDSILHPETDSSVVLMEYGDTLEQFNRDVLSELDIIPRMTSANTQYYVATTGSDSNNGLTVGTAFKTIQHAIDILPRVINHAITINIASGTYNESVMISGHTGKGYIEVIGDTVVSSTRVVNDVSIENTTVTVAIKGLNLINKTKDVIRFAGVNYASVFNVKIDGNASFSGIFVTNGSTVYVGNSVVNNTGYAMSTDLNGNITAINNSGSGNAVVFYSAHTGVICTEGTEPSGTTKTLVYRGGRVIGKNTFNVPSGYKIHEDGMIEQWGSATALANIGWCVVNYPIAFAHGADNIQITNMYTNSPNIIWSSGGLSDPNATQLYCIDTASNTTPSVNSSCYWRALGW